MHRRPGVLAVGTVLSLVLATAAYATNNIEINSGKVPGGAGKELVVNVTYSCDASSGIEKLLVKALDEDRKAEGTGEGTTTCDGALHPADITVESPTPFHKGDAIDVFARFADGSGTTVGDPKEAKPLYAE